jgi:hypothetical protein
MAGALGRTLDEVFHKMFAEGVSPDGRYNARKNFSDDIADFVREF